MTFISSFFNFLPLEYWILVLSASITGSFMLWVVKIFGDRRLNHEERMEFVEKSLYEIKYEAKEYINEWLFRIKERFDNLEAMIGTVVENKVRNQTAISDYIGRREKEISA